jgi:hypothetical protein
MIEEAQQSVMWVRSKSACDLLETLAGRKSELSVRPHWVDNRLPPYLPLPSCPGTAVLLLALYPNFKRVSPFTFMFTCAHLPSSWGAHPVFFFPGIISPFFDEESEKIFNYKFYMYTFFSSINSTNYAILGSNFTKIFNTPKMGKK